MGNYITVCQAEEGSSDGVTEISEVFTISYGYGANRIGSVKLPTLHKTMREAKKSRYSSYKPISPGVRGDKKQQFPEKAPLLYRNCVLASQSMCFEPRHTKVGGTYLALMQRQQVGWKAPSLSCLPTSPSSVIYIETLRDSSQGRYGPSSKQKRQDEASKRFEEWEGCVSLPG